MSKLWGGRFGDEDRQAVEKFTASIGFDQRLYRQDIEASLVHVRMLARQEIISAEEGARIEEGLQELRRDIEAGDIQFCTRHEDIHMNVEALLTERIGEAGGRLHTARSRNDQIAVDMHLYMKDEICRVQGLITSLQESLLGLAREHVDVIMPGYTHLQRAQPVLFSHHLMAYFMMFQRDHGRLSDCLKRTDVCPLGAGALAGTSFGIDREWVARELGFSSLYENSIDAVSDRDFLLEFLSAAAISAVHLSRLSEEIILWSSAEFGFVGIDDAYATGSSIMPQKKNPDTLELVRGRTGRIYGDLVTLLTVMKAIPLAYHSDMQEDKEAVFDALDTLKACLEVTRDSVASLKINAGRMREAVQHDFATATDASDYLVRKGLPFRQAHHVVGRVVRHCMDSDIYLGDLTPGQWREFHPCFGDDIVNFISPEQSVHRRSSRGGTAPESVRRQMRIAAALLKGRESGDTP